MNLPSLIEVISKDHQESWKRVDFPMCAGIKWKPRLKSRNIQNLGGSNSRNLFHNMILLKNELWWSDVILVFSDDVKWILWILRVAGSPRRNTEIHMQCCFGNLTWKHNKKRGLNKYCLLYFYSISSMLFHFRDPLR